MGRMINHPMEEAIIGIVGVSHLVGASSLWKLQLIPLLEQMEYYNHLLIFEGVLLRRKLKLLIIIAALLGLRRSIP